LKAETRPELVGYNSPRHGVNYPGGLGKIIRVAALTPFNRFEKCNRAIGTEIAVLYELGLASQAPGDGEVNYEISA
jgi:hypothetical protein